MQIVSNVRMFSGTNKTKYFKMSSAVYVKSGPNLRRQKNYSSGNTAIADGL